MDQDQKICPRCGGPAGDYRFCDPCRSHIDSLLGIPPRDLALSSHPSHAAAEALPRDQAVTAEANGSSDRIDGDSLTTVEAPAEPGPAADADRSGGTLDVAKLPGGRNERLSDVPHRRPDVARLEDVLTVDHRDRIAPRTAAAAAPVAEPAHTASEGTAAAAPDDALERAKRELARLEDALAAAAAKTAAVSTPVAEPASAEAAAAELSAAPAPGVEAPTSPASGVLAPSYLAAHALRAAFLYEQTAAFEQASSIVPDDDPDEVAAPAPRIDVLEVKATSVPPPNPSASVPPPDPSASVPPPDPSGSGIRDQESPSVLRLWLGHASRTNWLAALCLLSLIVMVVVLTGRAPRRLTGGRTG